MRTLPAEDTPGPPPTVRRSSRFTLNVTLLEDLHSGTGATEGALDAVQSRDRHGRPVVTRSHVRGLLREAGYDLLRFMPEQHANVETLFGRPGAEGRGALSLTALRQASEAASMLTWTSTARRSDDRGPLTDSLRSREYVSAGTAFSGEMEISDPDLAALLALSVQRLTHIGARRNRGAGLILTALQQSEKQPKQPVDREPVGDKPQLRLLLRSLEPLCLADTGAPDNMIRTECYLRGQAIQGAFVGWLLRHGLPAADLLQGAKAPDFGNGYPLPGNAPMHGSVRVQPPFKEPTSQQRSDTDVHGNGSAELKPTSLASYEVMPIPLDHPSFKPEAQVESHWPWWAENSLPKPTQSEQKPKRPGDREFLFRSADEGIWKRYEPIIAIHMRNNAGESLRRHEHDQQLFSQEEIAEDTLFMAEVVFPSQAAATTFSRQLDPVLSGHEWLRVGRGGAPVDLVAATWMPEHGRMCIPDGSTYFSLTLVSDLIARGKYMGYVTDFDISVVLDLSIKDEALRERLGRERWNCHVTQDLLRVHGFNAVTGLPRIPALAIRRGSRIRIEGPATALREIANALAACEALGERQREGFGRFRIDVQDTISEPFENEDHANDSSAFSLSRESPEPNALKIAKANQRVTRLEHALKEGNMLADELLPPGVAVGPSPTQWIALSHNISSAVSHDEIDQIVDRLGAHAQRLAGRSWKNVRINLLRLYEREVPTETLLERKLRLDAALRCRIALAKRHRREKDGG